MNGKYWILVVSMIMIVSCSTLPKHFFNLDSRTQVSLEETLLGVKDAPVIFLGEIHADIESQAVQYETIRFLHNEGKSLVIAIEVFPPEYQEVLDGWVAGEVHVNEISSIFLNASHLPFNSYRGIFEFARDHSIPIVSIDAVSSFISEVSREGAGKVPGELVDRYKYSQCSDDPGYARLLGFSGNRDYHQSGLPFMCDGQRMRDSVMAYNIAVIINRTERTVVVLTGIAHAAKPAVPAMLKNHVSSNSIVVLPGKIRYLIRREPSLNVADYIWY